MNTKKVMKLSIAGLLGTQPLNFALAQDRVSQVGQQALSQAESQMLAVQAQMQNLDVSLVQLKAAIEQRSQQGVWLANTGMISAAGALGLSGVAAMTLRSRSQSASLIITSLLGVMASSAFSGVTSGTSILLQQNVNTADLKKELVTMQTNIKMALSTVTDAATRSILVDLEAKTKSLEAEVNLYADQTDSIEFQKVSSSVLQLVGSGLLMGAIFTGQRGFNVAPVVVLAGNVGQLVVLLRDDQVDEVLAAIDQLRTKIKTASYQY